MKYYHLIAIGGIGMSAIARVLLERGHRVSGSDLRASPITADLQARGAQIHIGHDETNLGDAEIVVASSAIAADNPEILAARRRGIPILKRAEMLGQLMAGQCGVCIAGTHGKTTTTAMIARIALDAGLDPTFIVGGILPDFGTNARSGQSDLFVIEADEYDRTFLGLHPWLAVITHLEHDHPDCYANMSDMIAAFQQFVQLVPSDGHVLGCGDVPRVRQLAEHTEAAFITYGLTKDNLWQARDLRVNQVSGYDFAVRRAGEDIGEFSLQIPGRHNVQNALAAIAATALVATQRGLRFDEIITVAQNSLRNFRGVQRRFELKGKTRGIIVIDDYAHHPTEIQATLAAARQHHSGRRICAIFQPHTYTRTKALLDDFAHSFADADEVIVTGIYAAREHDDLGMSGASVAAAINATRISSRCFTRYIKSLEDTAAYLIETLRAGDLLITLGAGDGYKIGEMVLERLS